MNDKKIPIVDNILDFFLKRPINPNVVANEIIGILLITPSCIRGVRINIKATTDIINDKIPKI
tara:strand:+ start:256 stop:444 length:189 start_codon:yes stop_codon:yes gene_type:complete